MEGWKNGRVEEWKNGKMEWWKIGKMWQFDNLKIRQWKNGRMGNFKTEIRRTRRWKEMPTGNCMLPYAIRRLATGDWRLATAYFFLTPHASCLFFTFPFALVALRFAK